MSMELWQRLKDLEKKVAEQSERIVYLEKVAESVGVKPGDYPKTVVTSSPDEPPAKKMSLCPKCGVKPAYFFHVKNCRGNAEVA